MTTLTAKELQTVKSLISLGDSKVLAIQTVINDRENEAKRKAQLVDYTKTND